MPLAARGDVRGQVLERRCPDARSRRYAGDLWAPKMAAITGEQRLAILRLKRARAVGALQSPGVDIYEAVVDHDVATPEAFLAWQAANRSEG